jgi:ribosome-binding ATPase YchF (GTP1/OBG family)
VVITAFHVCLSIAAHATALPLTNKPALALPFQLLQYAELAEGEREAWAKEQGADSALAKIITTGFKAIHLIYFFTAGADEVKCWQIRKGSKAPQVGGGRA